MSNRDSLFAAFVVGIVVASIMFTLVSCDQKTQTPASPSASEPNDTKEQAKEPDKEDNQRPIASYSKDRKSTEDLQRQISDFEHQLVSLESEHSLLTHTLQQVIALAEKEKAVETEARLKGYLEKKNKAYQEEVRFVQRSLKRLRTIVGASESQIVKNQAGAKAPLFGLMGSDGKMIKLGDYRGSIVVMEWLNPNCPHTIRYHERGRMQGMVQKYTDSQVVWLGINSTPGDTQENNSAFAEKYGLTYPILDDSAGAVSKQYQAKSSPHIFIIDRQGVIAYNGSFDDDIPGRRQKKAVTSYVDQALSDLVAAKSVQVPFTQPFGTPVGQRIAAYR
jgi:peroxiredoxin